ncbi:MAG: TlpA disulfide reductase family protein, partial [Enhygromyxa sp.]
MSPRSWMVVTSLAALVACARPSQSAPEPVASSVEGEQQQVVVTGRVVRDGAALPGLRVSYGGGELGVQESDEAGEFRLVVSDEFARAPALYLQLSTTDGHRFLAVLRNGGGPITASFDLSDPLRIDIELHGGSPEDQAWVDVLTWAEREASEWLQRAKDDYAGHLDHMDRIAKFIAAEPDDYRRELLTAAQFHVGFSDPEHGHDRSAIAHAALDQLGLEHPGWAMYPALLMQAAYESGRQVELAPRLEELITRHPQPDVATWIALLSYMDYSGKGAAAEAEAVWQRWVERPALVHTDYASPMIAMGPERPLAPGQALPELCVEDLEGGELCLADLRGRVVVLEVWATWCHGCDTVAEQLRAAQAALPGDDAPVFVSITPHDEPEALAAFLRDKPMPWRHGWVAEAERDAFVKALGIQALPTLALIDAEGTIITSSP